MNKEVSASVYGGRETVPHARAGMELMWAVLPAVGLAVLLLVTWRAIRATDVMAPVRAARAPVAT